MDNAHVKFDIGCSKCKTASSMTSCKDGNRVPCILLKSLQANVQQFTDISNISETLFSESPFEAIEYINNAVNLLDFVALYENEATFKKFSQIVSSTFEEDGNYLKEGKLWIRHHVVNQIVLGCSFVEWLPSKATNGEFYPSPLRIHLLITSDFRSEQLIQLLQLIYSSEELPGFYIPVICLNNDDNNPSIVQTRFQSETRKDESVEENLLLNFIIKLCVVLKNELYCLGSYVIVLIAFRIHLTNILLDNVFYYQKYGTLLIDIKYYFANILLGHFDKAWKIYQSIIFELEYENKFNLHSKNKIITTKGFQEFVLYFGVMKNMFYIFEKLDLNIEVGYHFFILNEGPIDEAAALKYYWPVLWSMLGEYTSLAENCWKLALENPLSAIKNLHDSISFIEFDLLYEDISTRELIGDAVRNSLSNEDSYQQIGRLKIAHKVNDEFILGRSVLDWIASSEQDESISLSPFRIHLLVINHDKYNPIQLRNLIEFIYRKRGPRNGIFIPLLFIETTIFQTDQRYIFAENRNHKLLDKVKTDLLNSIYKFSLVLKNETCYFGRYTLQMISFQREVYIKLLTKLIDSVKLKKSDNETLNKIISLMTNDLFFSARLEHSKVFEFSLLGKSNNEELNEDGFDYEFKHEVVTVGSCTPFCIDLFVVYFICHLLIERTSMSHFINSARILWFVFGVPLHFIRILGNFLDDRPFIYSKKYELADSLIIDMINKLDTPPMISDIVKAIIEHYDEFGESETISINYLNNIEAFTKVLEDFQNRIKSVIEFKVKSSAQIFEFPDSTYQAIRTDIINRNLPVNLEFSKQRNSDKLLLFFDNFKFMDLQECLNDKLLYETYCSTFGLVHTLELSFQEKCCLVCYL